MVVVIEKEGRTFECRAYSIGCAMCEVSIYEVVRPNWKIFRTKYRDTYYFSVDDFDTIKEGVEIGVEQLLKEELHAKEVAKKWESQHMLTRPGARHFAQIPSQKTKNFVQNDEQQSLDFWRKMRYNSYVKSGKQRLRCLVCKKFLQKTFKNLLTNHQGCGIICM